MALRSIQFFLIVLTLQSVKIRHLKVHDEKKNSLIRIQLEAM